MPSVDKFGLNPEQKEAASTLKGPLEIIAGPGTGKTHTLVARAVNLIESGVKPSRICIVTFTNKAAKELKHRVEDWIGDKGTGLWAMTFHGLGVRFLYSYLSKMEGNKQRFPHILDESAAVAMVRDYVTEIRPDLIPDPEEPPDFDNIIERWNRYREAGGNFQSGRRLSDGMGMRNAQADTIIQIYEKLKNANYAFDFTDLLYCIVNSPHRRKMRFRFSHIMVDEAHDMNRIQLHMAKMLAGHKKNICIIYDADQAIYEWRGANPANIKVFQRMYPDSKQITLSKNYRSTNQIIRTATNLIAHNKDRTEKALISMTGDGPTPIHTIQSDEKEEARWIARKILHLRSDGVSMSDMAILFRTNQQSMAIEKIMRAESIPVKIMDGRSLFERNSVKTLLSYLTIIVDPHNSLALERILNIPSRGIGEKCLARLNDRRGLSHGSLWLAIHDLPDYDPTRAAILPARAYRQLIILRDDITHIIEYHASKYTPKQKSQMYCRFIHHNYIDHIKDIKEESLLTGILDDMRSSLRGGEVETLEEYLFDVLLASAGDAKNNSEAVNLLTIHAAKGLEYNTVFLSGMEEGILPWNGINREQERKLTYVGMTRAKRHLFLTCARRRFISGADRQYAHSTFIFEALTPRRKEVVHAKPNTVPSVFKT